MTDHTHDWQASLEDAERALDSMDDERWWRYHDDSDEMREEMRLAVTAAAAPHIERLLALELAARVYLADPTGMPGADAYAAMAEAIDNLDGLPRGTTLGPRGAPLIKEPR